MIFPLIALAGLLGIVAYASTRKENPATTTPASYPQSPPFPQGGPPGSVPGQLPGQAPGQPTLQEALYFEILGNGVRVYRAQYAAIVEALLKMAAARGVIANDPTVVQLVAPAPGEAVATQWVDTWNPSRSILAIKYAHLGSPPLPANTPKFLRAVAPGEEQVYAGPNGYYAVLYWAKSSSGGPGPVPGAPPNAMPAPPASATPDAFSGLPEGVAAQARAAYSGQTNPDILVTLADVIEGQYPDKMDGPEALRRRAKELRAEEVTKAAARGHAYKIRSGDMGSVMALHYTGDANRWRELPKVNPGMTIARRQGMEYLMPWVIGQIIALPSSWDTSRGLPPIAQQEAKT